MIIVASIICVLLVLDCLQTLDIKNHPELQEINVILGPHPPDGRIVIYFTLSILLFCLAVWLLPHELALIGSGLLFGVEAVCLVKNQKLGLKLRRK